MNRGAGSVVPARTALAGQEGQHGDAVAVGR